HGLDYGKCLHRRIADKLEKWTSRLRSSGNRRIKYVFAVQLIGRPQAAHKVPPCRTDIGHVEQDLARQLPLDTKRPVLNIGRTSVSRKNWVRRTANCIILIDKRRHREFRSELCNWRCASPNFSGRRTSARYSE